MTEGTRCSTGRPSSESSDGWGTAGGPHAQHSAQKYHAEPFGSDILWPRTKVRSIPRASG
jgi:hypothetical protein